jgi:peptidoglycan hydrolase-like protein with peptidoglycan-binding domain
MMNANQPLSPRSIAAEQTGDTHRCPANISFTEEELAFLNRESRALFTRMPLSGPGFECYGYGSDGNHHYGRSSTIQAVKHICAQWGKKHPNGPRIGVGDISLPDGGDTPAHGSHEDGVDVDFSVITNNGKEEPSNWRHGNYSQALTQEFVDLVWDNAVLQPTLIYFNDPQIQGVEPWDGHDDHLHVRFGFGENIPTPDHLPDDGTLQLTVPSMKGDRVKSLQLGLAKAGIAVGADSIFGQDTESAVKKFQVKHNLKADGVAGTNTLAKLAEVISAPAQTANVKPAATIQSGSKATVPAVADPSKTVSAPNQPSPDKGPLKLTSPFMKGDRVKSLQVGLAKAGMQVTADSVFGKDTESAVKQFQMQYGLEANGIADENTLIKLVEVISA